MGGLPAALAPAGGRTPLMIPRRGPSWGFATAALGAAVVCILVVMHTADNAVETTLEAPPPAEVGDYKGIMSELTLLQELDDGFGDDASSGSDFLKSVQKPSLSDEKAQKNLESNIVAKSLDHAHLDTTPVGEAADMLNKATNSFVDDTRDSMDDEYSSESDAAAHVGLRTAQDMHDDTNDAVEAKPLQTISGK